jgi:hypothetical protein
VTHQSVTRHLCAAAAVVALTALAAGQTRERGELSGGNGTLYVGTYAGRVLMIDEATEKVVGEIPLETGIPRTLQLSFDRTRFHVLDSTFQQIEIVDIASRKTLRKFNLSEANRRVRVRGFQADPTNRFVVALTRTATKLMDRFEIGPSTLVQYDLATGKVMRTIPWPKGEEREFINVQFSPDGKLMYFFAEDVTIFDTTDFKEVDVWELSRPLEAGTGRIEFGSIDVFNDVPGFFTGLFQMEDPVQRRRIMGIGRVNLAAKTVDFHAIGPATGVSFTMAPDRKKAYGLMQQIGRYEFWTFDLEGFKVLTRAEFRGRPRMAIKTSTNGKILYIFQAGNTIDLYEAGTYKYLRTITLDADMTTDLYVLPARPKTVTSSGGDVP